jgi:3-dehydroquinate dehydratase I
MAHRSTKRRPRVVGVIASRADLERAVRMRMSPDLFELRLDRLVGMADKLESALPKLRSPFIITARDPHEGGAHKLRLRQRRDLLARFLGHADYIDVELRLASALSSLLKLAENNNVRRIISFHDFKSTPKLKVLMAKAHNAKALGADIFKVATRTDTPMELGRLVDFITSNRLNLALAVMGIGKLGAISRVLLARAGSALVYASVGAGTDVEGQLSLKQLRAFGFGQRRKRNFIPSEVEESRRITFR